MDMAVRKDVYDLGEIPPLGHVPQWMHAWTLRPDRHGPPESALRREIIEVPLLEPDEVLVLVMAAGLNYNGVWACLGKPVSVFQLHGHDLHVPGSDASGVVWAVGRDVRNTRVGDHVVVHCHQDDGIDDECNGGDPLNSPSQRIWGYETPYGSFAQFTKVQARQILQKPQHLSWEESSCYTLTLATAFRMLFGHPPHVVRPGSNVLIWGAAGGLGCMAIQLVRLAGGNSIAVIGDERKRPFVTALGAKGVINRTGFSCWGVPPIEDEGAYARYLSEARRFGKAIRAVTGGEDVDVVFEHPGAETFPVSCLVGRRGGMIVFCASTSGFDLTFDARFVWTRQKRVQGSHFASQKQASEANRLVREKLIDPCLGEVFDWNALALAHAKMLANEHLPGNHAIRVCASAP